MKAGDRLGPYEIVEPIGAGGRGEVYRVRDPHGGTDVASKVAAERFLREVHVVPARSEVWTNAFRVRLVADSEIGPQHQRLLRTSRATRLHSTGCSDPLPL